MMIESIKEKVDAADWHHISEGLHENGYALLPSLLSSETCKTLISGYDQSENYRKTIVMERYRFGLGEYKYFSYPLPNIIREIRAAVYPKLAPIAARWMNVLNITMQIPETFEAMQTLSRAHGQTKPTVLILKYGRKGHNTLHQDLYGEVYFPMQVVLFLNEPQEDYQGGEFVLVQQTPRAQSKAIVLQPKRGDMLIFTTNFRPVKGSKGYYRATMKHGVSEVLEGERYTLGIIFHDALS